MSKSFEDLPPQQKQEINRLNQFQQNLEMISQQRVQMEAQGKELEHAVKELTEAGDNAVCYKTIGGMFIKMDQPKLLQETKERKESIEMRVKSLSMQEEKMKKTFEEQRAKIESMLGGKGQIED